MNQGQFEELISRLDRLIEMVAKQRPIVLAVPSDGSAVELMEEIEGLLANSVSAKAKGDDGSVMREKARAKLDEICRSPKPKAGDGVTVAGTRKLKKAKGGG